MRRFARCLLAVCGLCISGCTVPQEAFILPVGVRSSTQQVLIAESTESAFKTLDLADIQGKKVYLRINALAARAGEESPEESYIRSHIENMLLTVGATAVNDEGAADFALIINATAGADFYRRGLAPFVFSNLTKCCVSYSATLCKLPERKIISMKKGKGEEEYKETFIMFIGPFH